jgi:hypothetical protein
MQKLQIVYASILKRDSSSPSIVANRELFEPLASISEYSMTFRITKPCHILEEDLEPMFKSKLTGATLEYS